MSNSSSKPITSSTTSSESAPRSSTNEAVGVTSSSATSSCDTTTFFTRSNVDIFAFTPALYVRIACLRYAQTGLPSSDRHAAVHGHRLARDVGRRVRGEEGDHRPDVLRRPQPTERDLRQGRLPHLALDGVR